MEIRPGDLCKGRRLRDVWARSRSRFAPEAGPILGVLAARPAGGTDSGPSPASSSCGEGVSRRPAGGLSRLRPGKPLDRAGLFCGFGPMNSIKRAMLFIHSRSKGLQRHGRRTDRGGGGTSWHGGPGPGNPDRSWDGDRQQAEDALCPGPVANLAGRRFFRRCAPETGRAEF